jgi:choice-of-anchor B domain-containing protein
MKKTGTILLLLFFVAKAFSQLNMQLLDQIDYTPNANDIWAWVDPDNGKEYALVGLVTGVSVVDVSDPTNVVEVQFIPGASSTWRDIKTWGNYAYVTNESNGGVLVINLSGAPNNITWTNWSPNLPGLGQLNKCHNLYIDEFGYCYLAGCNINSGGMLLIDVFTTPGSPVYVGKGPAVYAHDVYARANKMYASEIYAGKLSIYDVTDKQNVAILASQQTPFNFTHNAWLSDDSNVVFTTDEKANAPVAAYNISDLSDIKELDQFRPIATLGTNVIPHNVHVWNDWLIISYYTDGGIIADASRPDNIIEVGNWDTFLGGSGFSGVWGAYPFLPSGNVLLTDIGTGLYVCGANYVRACWLEGKVTDAVTSAAIVGATVHIDSPQANGATSSLAGIYKTGQAIPGSFEVTFSATGYHAKTVQVSLENGVLTNLDVQLEPLVIPNFPDFTASTSAGCQPLTVTFNESSGMVASWSWTFENGDPATSTEQSPTVVFATPGSHDVTLEVLTTGGNTFSTTQPDLINVAPAPLANFTYSVDSLKVTFSNASSFYNAAQWNFGDGATSNALQPSHTYAAPGTYNVTLTVIGSCGSDVLVEEVTIGPFSPSASFSASIEEDCAPLTVEFTDQSLGFPETWAWSFPGGNPATSTEQHPVVTYDVPGTYDVQLTVSTGAGSDEILMPALITVLAGPTAAFDFSVNGPEAAFTNSSTNFDSQSWDFGDGETSDEANPSHSYSAPGTYTVQLTVENLCGIATFSQEITIEDYLPVAGFSANAVAGCSPLMVEFSDESMGGATMWQWSFPGGEPATSNEQNPVVTYNNPGTYDVSLVVTNAFGEDETTLAGIITVNGVPTPGFFYTNVGPDVFFTNTSSNATGYLWEFHDGTGAWSSLANPNHTFPGVGDYEVILYAVNGCGTASLVQTVSIGALPPVADFSFSGGNGCAPLEVAFTDQSQESPTAWAWSFPGGNPSTSNAQNPVVVYENPGTYSVSLIVTNAAGSSESSQSDIIVVNDLPAADFAFEVNGMEVVFTNTSVNGTSYMWDFDNGETSMEENPVIEFDAPGTYQVVLVAGNDCGSTVYGADVVINATIPTANFSASQTAGCAPLEVQFTDQSSDSPTAWAWSFPGGTPSTSTEQNPTVVYQAAGVYSVELMASNAAGTGGVLLAEIIVVDDVPSVGFNFQVTDANVDFVNTSSNADSYEWDFGDGNSSTVESPSHTYADAGEYEVTLTATNDCGIEVYTQTLNIEPNATHILDKKYFKLNIAPNPFSDYVQVQYFLDENMGNASLIVTNILGEEIVKMPVNTGKGHISIGDEIKQNGVYFIRIKSGNIATEAIRIVKAF